MIHELGRRGAAILAASGCLALILLIGGFTDPSGLLALYRYPGGEPRWPQWIGMGYPVLCCALLAAILPSLLRSRRRVFAVTWTAVVASVMAARFIASLVAVFGAAPGLDTIRFVAWTVGFSGGFAALIGWLPALAAAVVRRKWPVADRGGRLDRDDRALPPVRLAVAALLAAAIAILPLGDHWWAGSGIAYAYLDVRWYVAPAGDAGIAGGCAGLAVFVAAFTWFGRRLARGTTSAAIFTECWLAAILAGLALGLAQSALAGFDLAADAADLWPIPALFLRLSSGASYGAVLGLVVAGIVLLWRVVPRVRARYAALAVMPLVALPLLVVAAPVTDRHAPPLDAAGDLPALSVTDGVITDSAGRQVLLRGANVNQLNDYWVHSDDVESTRPLSEQDFAQQAALGFNVARLTVSWSALEPSPGDFDAGYVAKIRRAVAWAADHGIYTVIDMHQDAWGKYVAADADTSCPAGTDPMIGWDGAPQWATILDGADRCGFAGRDISPAVSRAFTNFYYDTDGIQTRFVETWGRLAAEFADTEGVAGFDLLNEPGYGEQPPVTSGLLLRRFYQRSIAAIRDAEARAGASEHLVFFEPSVLWSGMGFEAAVPPGFVEDGNLVFAPHPYAESITMDAGLGVSMVSVERGLRLAQSMAEAYDAALWLGEWGWFGDLRAHSDRIDRFAAQQDRLGLGGAVWVWKQACGDPHAYPGTDTNSSGLAPADCETGEPVDGPKDYLDTLSRPYPRAAPGRITTLESTPDRLRLNGTAAEGSCELDVWFPGDREPTSSHKGLSKLDTTRVDGGWRVTGCANGDYYLALK